MSEETMTADDRQAQACADALKPLAQGVVRAATPVGRWWVSWHQPTADYRPLSDPPHPQVLGWWCSGYDSGDTPILCAVVEASTPSEATMYIGISWPECERWRFIEKVAADFQPGDRFPLKPWMVERLAKAK